MSNTLLLNNLKEARRDALVADFIATKTPQAYQDKIKTADDLYEYLLLDTQISNQVKTSPIAEAISSLQLFIHRTMEGREGQLASSANDYFTPGKFLYNWDEYNKRYATWSGKERLKYYAGNYIDPTLRYNKSSLFKALEQNISQGRVTDNNVTAALQTYLTDFTALSQLQSISVCAAGSDESVLFFVGRTPTLPYQYYWRQLTLKKDGDNLVPAFWSEWKLIGAGITEAYNDYVEPVWQDNRLYIRWVSIEDIEGFNNTPAKAPFENIWQLNDSEVWNVTTHRMLDIFTINSFNQTHARRDTIKKGLNLYGFSNKMHDITITCDFKRSGVLITFNSMYPAIKSAGYTPMFHINEMNDLGYIENIDEPYFLPFEGSSIYLLISYLFSNNDTGNPSFISVNNFGCTLDLSYLNRKTNYGTITGGVYTPPASSKIKGPIYLTLRQTLNLNQKLEQGLSVLFDYQWQKNLLQPGEEFNGAYGLYLWEILFHIPFLIAVRFLTEQRFDAADRWLKFLFNSAGYRDANGVLETDEKQQTRFWNMLPLQQDNGWDDTLSLATTDPDQIAMADPMHYKLAVFLRTLDLLISRGDHAYRMLERDTLTEAKMHYVQASQLLGTRPEFRVNNSWSDPSLLEEAIAMTAEPTRGQPDTAPLAAFRALLQQENGSFLPPYNDQILQYWDKLALRLYNLRHNLSLDGQPLSLPLFATPADPKEIQRQQSAGDGIGSSNGAGANVQSSYRFPLLVVKARSAVSGVMQFGSTLLNLLEKQDVEAVSLLLHAQQNTLLQLSQDIQEKNLSALRYQLQATQFSRQDAQARQAHYRDLSDNWMSELETAALAVRGIALVTGASAAIPRVIAGAMDAVPNIFGLAVGGNRWGAIPEAVANSLQISSETLEHSATMMDISAGYHRRREEWQLARSSATYEVAQLDATIAGLQEKLAMAQKQLALSQTEQAQALALYEFQSHQFTSLALYNWMVGRLSALYYQLYDATVPVCVMAQKALQKELGTELAKGYFTLPGWNDLYQGLLAGETLMAELQKLDNLWLEHHTRGLEATKTFPLSAPLAETETFTSQIQLALNQPGTVQKYSGVGLLLDATTGIFTATLDLATVGLDDSYNIKTGKRTIKSLSVTLPALIGPYQDIEATLSLNGESVALSHGMDDSGLFITDFNDPRFLPFEGADPTSGTLTLALFRANEAGDQRQLLESLSDIIFHIRYVIRLS
ncbi:Tc toxin subunit A-related protein [Yersinia proxima]|uniref:Tc toxin subunit A-related protein n=1 Tax=Yersinia proxima TaxID=2890316 RepID=UPI000980AA22|nr:neuraminidase-like domain-containing protein [Yersinia proxima]